MESCQDGPSWTTLPGPSQSLRPFFYEERSLQVLVQRQPAQGSQTGPQTRGFGRRSAPPPCVQVHGGPGSALREGRGLGAKRKGPLMVMPERLCVSWNGVQGDQDARSCFQAWSRALHHEMLADGPSAGGCGCPGRPWWHTTSVVPGCLDAVEYSSPYLLY